jgi:phosphatidylinositol glycan class B
MNWAMGDKPADIRNPRAWFWGLLALAMALRIAAFDAYSAHHQDETIQYLEQAHRIVFGYGFVPWEYRYFIRSWLIPLLLVPPMQLGEWLNPGGTLYLVVPRALVAAANFTPVIAAWFIGKRISTAHAIVGMAVMALWVESVFFSVQTLSESLSVACFFAAVALLHREARFGAIVGAGALMALAGLFRFQFGPAIALYALLIAGMDRRIWAALLAGGLPVIVVGGLLDIAMGLRPYEWILNNYNANIAQGRMKEIGGVQTWYYLQAVPVYWKWAVVPILIFLLHGWRRNPALFAAALLNIAVHQLIGHKEYRYLWLSIDVLLLLAAFGSLDVARQAKVPKWASFAARAPIATAIGLWAALSLSLAVTPTYRIHWRNAGGPSRLAAETLRNPQVCGIAVPMGPYARFGYSLLHQPKPVFLIGVGEPPSRQDPSPASAGFNAILAWDGEPQPKGFPVKGDCMGKGDDRLCAYRRPGGCTFDERSRKLEYQQTLSRLNM